MPIQIPSHWIWMGGFMMAIVAFANIVALIQKLREVFGEQKEHLPCKNDPANVSHRESTRETLTYLGRIETALTTLSSHATRQTTLLEQIARNGKR